MPTVRILLIGDDPVVIRAITDAVAETDWELHVVESITAAEMARTGGPPAVTIFDLDMAANGIDVCRRMHQANAGPIIAISRDECDDAKVLTLDAGADDYITIPFNPSVVLARVRVALRHRAALAPLLDDTLLEVGTLRIDTAGYAAYLGARRLTLTPKEFRLLELLARNRERVVPHELILEVIWSAKQTPDTLRLHIVQLRKKLGDGEGTPRIMTQAGVGYALVTGPAPEQ